LKKPSLGWLACGCLLLVACGAVAFFSFGGLCLLVPCDRSLVIRAAADGVPAGARCEIDLTAGDPATSSVRSRDLEPEEDATGEGNASTATAATPAAATSRRSGSSSFVIGPWGGYRARLRCGDRASAWQSLDVEGHDTVDLGLVVLAAPTGPG
jgi:hypothetical protein